MAGLKFPQQVEDLRLHRHVQGTGGLVQHHEPGPQNQRARHRHPLALAAGELVGVAVGHGGVQPHLLQHFHHPPVEFRRGEPRLVNAQPLPHDLPHQQPRIEGGVGVLEDDLHEPPHVAEFLAVQRQQIAPIEHHAAPRGALQVHQAVAQGGLAAARLPHQPQGGALPDGQRHAVHRFDVAHHPLEKSFLHGKMGLQIPDFQQHPAGRGSCGAHEVGPGGLLSAAPAGQGLLRVEQVTGGLAAVGRTAFPGEQRWLGRLAAGSGVVAAVGEPAAGGVFGGGPHHAPDHAQAAVPADAAGDGFQQLYRVGVGGPVQQGFPGGRLGDPAAVHDQDAVAHLVDDPQVVGDQDQRHPDLPLQRFDQAQNLRLHGHVERGRGLIGDQQTRAAGDGHGDHHPLAHAAGKLVGKGVQDQIRQGDSHLIQQFQTPSAGLAGGHSLVL